jgi:hypothetical protein
MEKITEPTKIQEEIKKQAKDLYKAIESLDTKGEHLDAFYVNTKYKIYKECNETGHVWRDDIEASSNDGTHYIEGCCVCGVVRSEWKDMQEEETNIYSSWSVKIPVTVLSDRSHSLTELQSHVEKRLIDLEHRFRGNVEQIASKRRVFLDNLEILIEKCKEIGHIWTMQEVSDGETRKTCDCCGEDFEAELAMENWTKKE